MKKILSPPTPPGTWLKGLLCACATIALAYCIRMLEWPCWQNPEYSYNGEMLLATHDAYHWLAGASGFGLAVDHPMAKMLRMMASFTGASLDSIAFWSPAVLASAAAGVVFAWTWALGGMACGIAAGLIASIAPGFLARTLLGYYDTDLITLFFPLCLSLVPGVWVSRFIFFVPRSWPYGVKHKSAPEKRMEEFSSSGDPLSFSWIILLSVSGFLAWGAQSWHSVFPYVNRCEIGILSLMILGARRGGRAALSLGALAYALPALGGWWGMLFPIFLLLSKYRFSWGHGLQKWWVQALLWLGVAFLAIRGDILNTLVNHANAYLKHSGDAHSSGGVSLIFPNVAQSIIEVQDLSFTSLFPYFHPWMEAAIVGFAAFCIVCWRRPAALLLAPLAALALSSAKLGGRMVMFGAPIVAIGLSLTSYWLAKWLLGQVGLRRHTGWIACVTLCGFLVAPFLDMVPALSQGPILNRRHAEALAHARTATPPDAVLWLWWDWGYAAHYFARRQTIADGAMHGGPSLYLPAVVLATENPRFARQVIRRTSSVGNEPGNFFTGMDAEGAQELINRLRSNDTPLVGGRGRQYLIVSFEMLKLGFWISNFGSWNFITQRGSGGALSIIPQALSYNLRRGEVRLDASGALIFPASISVFDEGGVTRRDYIQEWFDSHPRASALEKQAWLASRRNINFMFNRVTDEKLAMDESIYNSLMAQLLICEHGNTKYSAYFKLIYDNVFARIYEVLPTPDDIP